MTVAAHDAIREDTDTAIKPDLPNPREQRLTERRTTLLSRIRWANRFRVLLALLALFFIGSGTLAAFRAYGTNKEINEMKLELQKSGLDTERSEALKERIPTKHEEWDEQVAQAGGGLVIGATFLVWCLALTSRTSRNELIDVTNELDLISIPTISYEQKAQKLLQMQQLELKRYYSQTLHQSAYIFWVGVVDMLVGIAVVGVTIWLVQKVPGTVNELWEKGIIGVVGAIGGILTNYVGVIYIKMFSEIIKGVTHSHDALVTMNHLHLANMFVADIDDKTLREKTLSDLALALKLSFSPPVDSAVGSPKGS